MPILNWLRAWPCDPPVRAVRFDGPPNEQISHRLKLLFETDQAERQAAKVNWSHIDQADRQRRREVMGYLHHGQVLTPNDLFHAAMIFQHGNCLAHIQLANTLAERAMNAGHQAARWLYAASFDRALTRQGKPQRFGTQYRQRNGQWELYPVAPETTDDERLQYGVPPMAVILRMAQEMNAKT